MSRNILMERDLFLEDIRFRLFAIYVKKYYLNDLTFISMKFCYQIINRIKYYFVS